jgi:MFS family permease
MGLGYFLVGAAPTYVLILGALMVASIAGSIWHPTARGLLSQIYPHRRGFMITVDRSAGALGDSSGPLIASWLLAYLLWQEVFLPALPLALLFMFFLWVLLRRSQAFQAVGARSKTQSRPLSEQLRALMGLFRENSRILSLLILIKAIAGFAQGGLFVWLPFYLRDVAGMSELGYGFHLSLLTAMGIVTGPGFGYLSDRIGRMPVIVIVLAAKTAIAALIAFSGTGLVLTLLIAAMGTVNLVVNPLVQTWALDIAHGRRLEGSTLGVLDGANFIFTGIGPLLVGFVVHTWGFESLFWYIAAISAAALGVVMFTLPFARAGWQNRM